MAWTSITGKAGKRRWAGMGLFWQLVAAKGVNQRD